MADIRDGDIHKFIRAKAETNVSRNIRQNELIEKNKQNLQFKSEETGYPEWYINVCNNCEGAIVRKRHNGDLYTKETFMGKECGRLIELPSKASTYWTEGDIINGIKE